MVVTTRVPLSVLDLAPVPEGMTPADAFARSVDLIRLVEGLGFRRYWVAEHHNMPGIASAAPAVLIAHLAAQTERIRVGSGGVMLSNHAPLVIAEQFGTLESLHPGRIDLGLGRAPGTDRLTMHALRRRLDAGDEFPSQLAELDAYFDGRVEGIQATPGEGSKPDIWLLGSSGFSAQLAGMLGLPFSFAHHFAPVNTYAAAQLYLDSFRPSTVLAEPYLMIGTGVVCAPTVAEARFLASSTRLSVARLHAGRPGRLPTPEEATAYGYSEAEEAALDSHLGGYVVGDPMSVCAALDALVAATGANELMVATTTYDPLARLRSFELLDAAWRGGQDSQRSRLAATKSSSESSG